jgi:RNA polymerase sigma factor (sigma-70 family)
MPQTLTRLLHSLRRMATPEAHDTDAALLGRFCRDRDETAFAALMARHGPMVLGVCGRVLRDAHAADDAFQATFLVLAKKAGSVGRPESLAGWLYGVAYRVSLKARSASDAAVSAESERLDPRPDPLAELSARDLLAVLEQEVQRLPEAFRLPVALCCLEGLSQEEACQRLGWAAGSLKGRLERGRQRLRQRLTRRGVTLAAALAAVEASRGAVSAALVGPTARAAFLVAAGAWPVAEVSERVIVLAQGGIQSMTFSNMKTALVLLAAFGLVGSGAGWLALGHGEERLPAAAEPRAKAKAPANDDREGRDNLIERLKKQQQQLAAEAEHIHLNLSEKLVEARERLADLEVELREAEEAVRFSRGLEVKEIRAREELAARQNHLSTLVSKGYKADHWERKEVQKRVDDTLKSLTEAEKERGRNREAALAAVKRFRRLTLRAEEDIRILERIRATTQTETDRKREAIAERIRQLEGFAEQGGDDRRTRHLERKLDSLQTTLDELSREVRRLRAGKKE